MPRVLKKKSNRAPKENYKRREKDAKAAIVKAYKAAFKNTPRKPRPPHPEPKELPHYDHAQESWESGYLPTLKEIRYRMTQLINVPLNSGIDAACIRVRLKGLVDLASISGYIAESTDSEHKSMIKIKEWEEEGRYWQETQQQQDELSKHTSGQAKS